jgi:hypothetical protein
MVFLPEAISKATLVLGERSVASQNENGDTNASPPLLPKSKSGYLVSGTHVVVFRSYLRPGAAFSASLVVSSVR